MSYKFPSPDHEANEYFDVASINEILAPENVDRLPFLDRAISSARKSIAEQKGRGIMSITTVCIRSTNDDRILIEVGKRGGWRVVWNFGH